MKKFERSLSLPYVVAIAIGGMLGSGLFVLPGIAAAKTGPSVWLAYLLAALCVLPAALSKAEMATAMPTSGGTYVYIERTFGPLLGTISGIGLWLSLLLKSSFALVGFGAYLLILMNIDIKVAALISLGLIMILNISGVKKVGKAQLVVLILSILGLAALVFFGFISFDVNLTRPAITHGTTGLIAATAFVFVSYAGVTKVAAIAEEIKNPDRNLPAAMILALLVVTTIYVLVTFVLVGNVSVAELKNDIHPIYTFAQTIGGKAVGIAAAILGVVTLMSMANSGVLAASRFPFAMSRDRLLPARLSTIHPKFLTPTITIIATCAIMALAIIFLDVEKIAKLASAFKVTMFICVNACVIVLRETSVHWYKPSYHSPLYPYLQVFGIVTGLILLLFLGLTPIAAIFAIALVGYLAFQFYGKSRAQRKGVLQLYGHQPALSEIYRKKRSPLENEVVLQSDNSAIENQSVENLIRKDANVVVALFGKENSPEMIAEMGLAIAGKQEIQVAHITEVPEQTLLDAMNVDSIAIKSIERRLKAMAVDKSADFRFQAVATHELVKTMYTISNLTHCKWMIMGWEGRSSSSGLLVRNPIGWLTTHLKCHFALFKDNGVRYFRKILVCLRPGREDALFLQAADNIANYYGAEITFLRVIKENRRDDMENLRSTSDKLLEGLRSKTRLDIEISNEPTDAILKYAIGYDLLVTGTPLTTNLAKSLFGSGRDKFAESAPCSLLRLTIRSTDKYAVK